MSGSQLRAVAAIDCGTNSTRLLIVDSGGGVLVRSTQITRLGEGVDQTGALSEHAIRRTLKVLRAFQQEMTCRGVERGRLVATSAVRDAGNREDFLARASAATGINAELLTGDEEGRLAYEGASASLAPEQHEGNVVLDIGGGSTELIQQGENGPAVVSLPLGSVRLTERHLHHDPPTSEEIDETVRDIRDQLASAALALPQLPSKVRRGRLIGLAGTVSTLAALAEGLRSYTCAVLHHHLLSRTTVVEWCTQLAEMTTASREALPSMMTGRANVIVAGVLILREVMAWLQVDACTVSEQDILDGLVLSMLQAGVATGHR